LVFLLTEPPKVISHPRSQEIILGKPVAFTVQVTGTTPLTYQWQCMPAKEDGREEDGSEEWQLCPSKWSDDDDATLTIPSIQKFNAGSYRCIIRNCVGTIISKPAQLTIGKNKR